MTGGGGGGSEPAAVEQAPAVPAQQYNQPMQQQGFNPCEYEMRDFLQCAQNQQDITLCQGFNEVLRSCKLKHGTLYYVTLSCKYSIRHKLCIKVQCILMHYK